MAAAAMDAAATAAEQHHQAQQFSVCSLCRSGCSLGANVPDRESPCLLLPAAVAFSPLHRGCTIINKNNEVAAAALSAYSMCHADGHTATTSNITRTHSPQNRYTTKPSWP
jgi:hypothetical protein